MKQPRNLFRSRGRQRGNVLRVTPFPEASYHDTTAELVRQNPQIFPRGKVTMVEVGHDPDCRRPQGEPCTCNPDVKFAGDPEAN